MTHLLNEQTNTIHKRQPGTTSETTTCGALRHVPHYNITSVETDETQWCETIDRCGRCFEDAGGY